MINNFTELKDNQEKFDMVVNDNIGKLPFPFNLISVSFFDYLNVFYEQQIKLNNDIINNIKSYQIQTQPEFITIYKKEMPKGGYFEGCTLELVTLNKKFIKNGGSN